MQETLNVKLEIKALNKREFEGHGSIFGNVDLGGDVVLPGAFEKSLNEHKTSGTLPAMLYQHRPDQIAGVWTEMHEDQRGLFVKGTLIDTPIGNQAYVELQAKALRGLSIGFETVDAEHTSRGGRKLKEVNLWEVSLVTFPMNQQAMVEAVKRAIAHNPQTPRELEDYLREAGSRSEARGIIAQLARIFDAPTGGKPDEHVDEAAALLKSIEGLTDCVQAEIFK